MDIGTIGIKELHKKLNQVAKAAKQGQSFIVFKHLKPLFRIEPIHAPQAAHRYTRHDLARLQFKNSNKHLSKGVDSMVYGL